ncbi:MAG: ComEA family DNA-binding protein [Polaribacter sp.]
MKKISPHFWYSKSQRNGVFILLLFIVVLQMIYWYLNNKRSNEVVSNKELAIYQRQIDSLRLLKSNPRKQKIFQFNPNFISDYKGYQLGLSIEEIDRLHKFRKQGEFVNSVEEFQKVTQVSDSLLETISPFFKFPKWKTNLNQKKGKKFKHSKKPIVNPSTKDINKATQSDLKLINGIGEKLSARIIKYRNRIKGFTFKNQMDEVWGLDPAVINRIWDSFRIIEKPIIKKININTASFKEVLTIPYIDYKLCKRIFEYRDQVAEFQNLKELQRIDSFPKNKYDRIVLYLSAD